MSMPEATPPDLTLAEYNPDQEQLQRADELRQLFSFDDALIDRNRERIWTTAERVAGLVFDPVQRQAIATHAEIAAWTLFAKPGSSLPAGTLLLQDNDGFQQIARDQRRPYMGTDWLRGQFMRSGLKTTEEEIHTTIKDREEQIKSLVRDIIYDTAEYKFLVAFDNPLRDLAPKPLNTYWHQVRVAQTKNSLSEKYGTNEAGDDKTQSSFMPFRQELQRRLRQIDDETMPEKAIPEGQQNIFARVRAYFTPLVLQSYITSQKRRYPERSAPNVNDLEILYVDDSGSPGIVDKGRDPADEDYDYSEVYEYAMGPAAALSQDIYSGPTGLQPIARTFLEVAIERLLDPRLTGNYLKTLDRIVDESTSNIVYELSALYSSVLDRALESNDYAIFLKQPLATPVKAEWHNQHESAYPYGWDGVFGSKVQLSTADEIMRDKFHIIGETEMYGPDNFRAPMRLFLPSMLPENLPAHPQADEVLTIRLDGFHPLGQGLLIPGYKLIRHSPFDNRYGFAVDPEGDPYAACNVAVPNGQQKELAEMCRAIGLEGLADDLEDFDAARVTDIVKLVKKHSHYYAPTTLDHYNKHDALLGQITHISSLSDFGRLVRDGALQVQCTGAAQFLRYSLEKLFGHGCANTLSGNVLSGISRNIDAAKHAQTIFVHGGKQYILDATPASSLGEYTRGSLPDSGLDGERYNPPIPRFDKPNQPMTDAVQYAEKPTITLQERVTNLTKAHLEYLKVNLGVPTKAALYDHLVKLPSHDPARISLEMLLRFANGTLSADEVEHKIAFLESCKNADATVRKQLGFYHYPVPFLEQLSHIARRLRFIARSSQKS